MKIKGQTFVKDDIELDGNIFEDCIFDECRMFFDGRAPVRLSHCTFNNVFWHLRGPASLTADFIRGVTDSGDYGRALLVLTFPAIKPWIKQEYLDTLGGPKEDANG